MRCMVVVQPLPDRAAEIAAHIREEQAAVHALVEKGIAQGPFIAADRPCVWLIVSGESLEEVGAVVKALPLYPHSKVEIVPLRG